MGTSRSETFAVELPDGLTVERLPLGIAAGHWWLAFVISGPGPWLDQWLRSGRAHEPLAGSVRLAGPNGPFTAFTTSGGGNDRFYSRGDVFHGQCEFGLIDWVDIAYTHNGTTLATEHLDLSSSGDTPGT